MADLWNEEKSIIPDGREKIYEKEFFKSDTLTDAVIPGSVKTIGKRAFCGCYNLVNVEIGDGVERIESHAFAGCKSLRTVTIPGSVKVIEAGAFSESGIESVIICEGTEEIGEDAFYRCVRLKEIEIPGSVKRISKYMCHSCVSLEKVSIGDGVEAIDEYAFRGSGVRSITVPGSVVYVGSNAFFNCISLENIILTTGIKEVRSTSFAGCINLRSITIGSDIELWGWPFGTGKKIEEITAPRDIKEKLYSCIYTNTLFLGEGDDSITYELAKDIFSTLEVPDKAKDHLLSQLIKLEDITVLRALFEVGVDIDSELFDNLLKEAIATDNAQLITMLIEEKRKMSDFTDESEKCWNLGEIPDTDDEE